jgi:hypothetical protein
MKIQIDTPQELHKKLNIEKAKRELNTLAETVIKLLEEKLTNGKNKN